MRQIKIYVIEITRYTNEASSDCHFEQKSFSFGTKIQNDDETHNMHI